MTYTDKLITIMVILGLLLAAPLALTTLSSINLSGPLLSECHITTRC